MNKIDVAIEVLDAELQTEQLEAVFDALDSSDLGL